MVLNILADRILYMYIRNGQNWTSTGLQAQVTALELHAASDLGYNFVTPASASKPTW